VHPELSPCEPLGGVSVEADDVFPWCGGGERELSLATVHLAENDLVVRIPDLDVHSYARTRGCEPIGPGVVQLDLVVAGHHRLVGDLLNEALSLRLAYVEVEG